MARVSLLGGSYAGRSIIANAQRCVNLYPERTPDENEPPTPVTHMLTPGLVTQVTPAVSNVRCLYRTTTGFLFTVIGNSVYYIDGFFAVSFVGLIASGSSPVSISDNGLICVLVDGTGSGYWWPCVTPGSFTFHTIADAAFYGATRVCFLDGRFVFNRPFTNQFYLSPSFWDGVTAFDPTYIASKVGGPDQINNISVIRGELWLVGTLTTEVWFNAGGADFPFERQPGVFIDHGLHAPYSLSETDVETFWLHEDRAGWRMVMMGRDYQAIRISNHALEEVLQSTSVAMGAMADAIGFVYQQDGHTFYVLTLPTADQTWVYDLSTGQWHQRCSFDIFGNEHRWRVNCATFTYGVVVGGDYANGKLYSVSLAAYDEDGAPIWRKRSFPHIVSDGKRISYTSFTADMDVSATTNSDQLFLRWSNNRGATYGSMITIGMGGLTDNTIRSLVVQRLGMARDRVFELSWFFPRQTSLNGAWIETEKAET